MYLPKYSTSNPAAVVFAFWVGWHACFRRYLFYTFGVLKSQPYPLFFLRYSLFAILYPTGIVGEVMTMVAALPDLKVTERRSSLVPHAPLFVPGRGFFRAMRPRKTMNMNAAFTSHNIQRAVHRRVRVFFKAFGRFHSNTCDIGRPLLSLYTLRPLVHARRQDTCDGHHCFLRLAFPRPAAARAENSMRLQQ